MLTNYELKQVIELVVTNNQYNSDDEVIQMWDNIAEKLSLLQSVKSP